MYLLRIAMKMTIETNIVVQKEDFYVFYNFYMGMYVWPSGLYRGS